MIQLEDSALQLVTEQSRQASRALGFEDPIRASDIHDVIRAQLKMNQSESV
jgi:hypothetical protein